MKRLIAIFISFVISFSATAQELNIYGVGEAEIEKAKVAFLRPGGSGTVVNALSKYLKVMENDFSFYKKDFQVVQRKETSGGLISNYDFWAKGGVSYLIELVGKDSGEMINVDVIVKSVIEEKEILSKTISVPKNLSRRYAHELADIAYQAVTGKESIFNSRIVFVSDRGASKANQFKELYIMDFDGANAKQLTSHRGTVISPAISHDGKKVLYSLIEEGTGVRNIDLYLLDLETGKKEVLSKRNGINSGAIFSHDDKKIYLTLSQTGDAELYEMDLQTKKLRRLTRHFSPDVDPSITKDGKLMTFLSGRSGPPFIFTLDPSGIEKDVKRISYVGKYNATPRFNPEGTEIAFASWLDNRFDIFRIGADGRNLVRLTKNFGSNEDPTYSNDGQFIAFSSQRVLSRTKAVNNIYIMDRDGEILGQITKNLGNCITPRWTK